MDVVTIVTPSLHPENITAIDGYDDDTMLYAAPAKDAFGFAYEGIQKIWNARELAGKNKAFTESSRQLLVAELGEKVQHSVAKKFDIAMSSMNKTIRAFEEMLAKPLEASAERNNISAEIRNHVKNLSTEDRSKFLSNAQTENDFISLRAILGAPGYLSGISEVERQARTRMYQEKNAPDVSNRLKVMKAAKEMIEKRAGLVFGEVQRAIGTDWATIKKLREANVKATAALKFE